MEKLFLLRYDTESHEKRVMKGFLDKIIEVHRKYEIPATFFCTGSALKIRKKQFINFYKEIEGDDLFDIQNHSYDHIGVGYEIGLPLEETKKDYEKSFSIHEQIFKKRPIGISICGVGGPKYGNRLKGFDETSKSKEEFEMLANMGMKMINSFLIGVDESKEFTTYKSLGHPEILGFPSSFSDTSWMVRAQEDPINYIVKIMEERNKNNEHMPLMLHDWVAWKYGDKMLTHVIKFVEKARELGYKLVTHSQCLKESIFDQIKH